MTLKVNYLLPFLLLAVIKLQAQELPLDGSNSNVLTFNPSTDPLGDIDNFKLIIQSEIEGEWSKDDGRNESEKLEEILNFNSVLHIDVKLVGFDGDGNYGIRISESQLLRYFETILEEHEKEAMVINARPGESHRLPLRRKFFFHIIKTPPSLNDDISSRIRSWLLTTIGNSDQDRKNALRDGVAVPVDMVDDLIRKDYVETELSGTHTIYLLNPSRVILPTAAGTAAGNGSVPRPPPVFKERAAGGGGAAADAAQEEEAVLAYWYSPAAGPRSKRASGTDSGGAEAGCGTTLWTGAEERCGDFRFSFSRRL